MTVPLQRVKVCPRVTLARKFAHIVLIYIMARAYLCRCIAIAIPLVVRVPPVKNRGCRGNSESDTGNSEAYNGVLIMLMLVMVY